MALDDKKQSENFKKDYFDVFLDHFLRVDNLIDASRAVL